MANEATTSSQEADAAMARYARGDEGAFAVVYDCVGPRLYAFLMSKTGDATLAEELTQQTFLQLHRARGRYIEGASVMSWTCAIAHRLLIDHARRHQTRARYAGAAPREAADHGAATAEQLLQARQAEAALHEQLQALPESQREAFELVKGHGMTHAEAAEVLGVTVPAIKALTHRAYKALRAVFDLGGMVW